MRKISLFLLTAILTAFLGSCNLNEPAPVAVPADEEPSALIINLISDPTRDPHSSLMGLHLGQKALKNDIGVTVFMYVHGVRLMGAGSDTLAFHGENLHQVLRALMDSGGAVRACPHCMEAHGIQAGQLLEGVEVMDDTDMMQKIKDGPTVFTY